MKKIKKPLIFILIIAGGVFLNKKYQWSSYITDSDNLNNIKHLVEENYLKSVVLYLIFTIIGSSVLALPGVTFAIVSTGLFGPWLGSFYCLLGTTIGATFSFLLSRYLLKDSIKDLVKKNEKLYNILFKLDEDKEFLILMITRLLPIFPFNLQNFAYGISNISLVKYSLASFIFMIPGILIFSLVTEGLINSEERLNMLLIGGAILMMTLVLGRFVYKKYKNLIVEESNEG